MLSKKVKSRILFLSAALIFFVLIIVFLFQTLRESVVYFFSPTEIVEKMNINYNSKIRIGGLVKDKSVKKEGNIMKFTITDLKNEVIVTYSSIVPNLFSEGKGVIAEGILKDKKYLIAEKILAKHDENYTPPEVMEILEMNK